MNAELLGMATVVVVLLSIGGVYFVENSDIQLIPELQSDLVETEITSGNTQPTSTEEFCYPSISPHCQ